MNSFMQTTGPLGSEEQFRLARLQLFNWGTFSDLFDLNIPAEGYLFIGPSGSGKSTILDAHAALLTPPKWVDFNVAAREAERHGKDRTLMTYLRGAWAQQTGDSGEYLAQFLRAGTTWSAIAETYRNDQGRTVALAEVFWVKGKSTTPGDVGRIYLVLERDFHLRELEFFARHDFEVRRFKSELPDAYVHREFSAYQERFRRLLGIENERALRLLHKTQSAKNLGDLNVFLRDFMLDAPSTFEIADRLVGEFCELNAAHQAVVAAREQIETLVPAREAHHDLMKAESDRGDLQALQIAVDLYREHRRKALLESGIAEQQGALDGGMQEVRVLAEAAEHESRKLAELQQQKLGMGAGVIDQLQNDIRVAESEKSERIRRRDGAADACKALGWVMADTAAGFAGQGQAARERVLAAHEDRQQLQQRKDELRDQHRIASAEFRSVAEEVKVLERQRSNLDGRLVNLRSAMAMELSIPEDKLPFAGELLEVKAEEAEWQGAIERVLGGFARSILVDDRHYSAVSAYINGRHIGERLAYFRVVPQAGSQRSPGAQSLVRKLNIATGSWAEWLREELKIHFDFECTDSLAAFRAASRAVTREGQVKHSATRHVKDDRERVDNRARWVLGFDNRAKLALYKEKAAAFAGRIAELDAALARVGDEESSQQAQLLCSQTLSNLTWNDVDVGSLVARIADMQKRLTAELQSRPDLARMDDQIRKQEAVYQQAVDKKNGQEAHAMGIRNEIAKLEKKLAAVVQHYPAGDHEPAHKASLDARFSSVRREVTLESLDDASREVERAINGELRVLDGEISMLRHSIVQRFAEFNRRWPAEAGGLDPVLESSEDYFGKLRRLETDDLPRFEERFLTMLRDQSDQNLTLLSTKLDQERTEIRARMELVNESLRDAPFGPGTHLVIETSDRHLEEVRQFRTDLKGALSHSFSAEPAFAEQRFAALAALVKRLASLETVDRNWRALVLDVRQHVEFIAREMDLDGIEVEVYRSGAGKSGGQRQKLAATCLAAALRYQLGGQDRALPSFSTVVLDEAFDKADAEFTAMAMNIFKTFGFQMVVATPLKSVMTLEPFIGGACFVHIKDRKKSALLPIDYDDATRRLKLAPHERHGEETVDA